jgi:hypothetical protein
MSKPLIFWIYFDNKDYAVEGYRYLRNIWVMAWPCLGKIG